jgi:hypothetical protein
MAVDGHGRRGSRRSSRLPKLSNHQVSELAGAVQGVLQQAPRLNRVSTPRFSPVWLVLVGILSVQFGAVISKGQFGEIPPVGMVFLRLITSP